MAVEEKGAPGQPAPAAPVTSYRTLGLFWATVLVCLGAGASALQVLGPPPHDAGLAAAQPVPPQAAPAAEAAVQPKQPAAATPVMAAPDAALMEPAADFPGRTLPVVGPGNRTPLSVYAAPFDATDKHPRVALVIAGAGLDQEQTLHLLNDLPGAVDVAFSPYMPENLDDQFAARTRATHHECLQSIPMEPTGYPLSEEGARSLLTGADSEQNRQNLEWALSRLPGCVGATGASDGQMGERFAQTGQGFADVLTEMSKRGLLYVDPRTGAPALATNDGANVRVVDLVIDQSPNAEQGVTADLIDQRLATLEHMATVRGAAIGLAGPPKPILLERIAVWAHALAAHGVTLVPVSAIPGPVVAPSADTLPAESAN